MTNQVEGLIREAIRRWLCFAESRSTADGRCDTLGEAWTGLGSKSIYKPVLDLGLMKWVNGREPAPRTMGWLQLTPKGVTMVRQYLKDKICKHYKLTI